MPEEGKNETCDALSKNHFIVQTRGRGSQTSLGEKDGAKVAAALGVKAVIPDARDPIIAPTPAPIGMVMGRRIKPYSS